MDERLPTDTPDEQLDTEAVAADIPAVEEASLEYLGRWNRLVSTTNWDKGRIICEWRQALVEASAPAADSSDEAWSQRVGNVSPQHVGRLRRTYQRFGQVFREYAGLYWSHFQAAVDWSDAEMYLEGAVQNDWSVAGMRHQRWEAVGAPADKKPRDEDVIAAEPDEDVQPVDVNSAESEPLPETISGTLDVVQDDESGTHDDSPSEPADADAQARSADAPFDTDEEESPVDPIRPFENLPPLPADMNEAFEAMKLAILGHKITGWQEISRGDVLSVLEALRQLALAPTED